MTPLVPFLYEHLPRWDPAFVCVIQTLRVYLLTVHCPATLLASEAATATASEDREISIERLVIQLAYPKNFILLEVALLFLP